MKTKSLLLISLLFTTQTVFAQAKPSRAQCESALSGIEKSLAKIHPETLRLINELRFLEIHPEAVRAQLIQAVSADIHLGKILTAGQAVQLADRLMSPELINRSAAHVIGRFLNEWSLTPREVVSRDNGIPQGPPLTTMPLPKLDDVDLSFAVATNRAALTFGENVSAIRRALHSALGAQDIELIDVSAIDYLGALESQPPKHQFRITFTSGTVKTATISIPHDTSESPATALPRPEASALKFQIQEMIMKAAGGEEKRAELIYLRFMQGLVIAKVNVNLIHSVEVARTSGGPRLNHEFKITYVSGETVKIEILEPRPLPNNFEVPITTMSIPRGDSDPK